MVKASLAFALLLFFSVVRLEAQYVETVITHPVLRDGLHVDASGNIYAASGGLAGAVIGRYDVQSETFDPNFATGFFGPVDVDQYRDSLLIVTNYDNNTVFSHNLNTGQKSIIAGGLDGPSGIAIDAQENIYVASWGNAPAYAGHQIHKIAPSGQVSLYIDSPTLYRPQAMTTDLNGTLVVHSNEKLYKVNHTDSILQLWITMGTTVGHMAFRQKDSCIYATAGSKILKINPAGEIDEFAGSTAGYQDGPLESARFKALLGIHFSPGEDTLYVCDSGYGSNIGRLRRIVMNTSVGNHSALATKEVKIYPNPARDNIIVERSENQEIPFEIFDARGQRLLKSTLTSYQGIINIKDFSPGTYFLGLHYPEGVLIKNFIKQ